ncbi:MAG TPA: DUF6752 domain-containing protein [Marmoricola sp.]|jgi:hypothetical protein|nr:DUF6752 domain-containing protein [Marmoricola sp.]
MANVESKETFRTRLVRLVGGGAVDELVKRINDLEAEVQENRNLNVRVAELVDVISELLLPIATQDQARIAAAIAKFESSL